jgi:hypothetical protein
MISDQGRWHGHDIAVIIRGIILKVDMALEFFGPAISMVFQWLNDNSGRRVVVTGAINGL